MKTITLFCGLAALSMATVIVACGDDETTGSGGSGPASSSTGMGGDGGDGGATGPGGMGGQGGMAPPDPPVLGGQIDRMGRAAIATATVDRFGDMGSHDASVDMYNENADIMTWVNLYSTDIAAQIAILDSLETVCGNQAGYDFGMTGTCPADGGMGDSATCYGTLATVLALDWLVINTAGDSTVGPSYLGVEGEATQFMVDLGMGPVLAVPADNTGGRMPAHDSIALSYTVLAGVPFDDGIMMPTPGVLDVFPYLADSM